VRDLLNLDAPAPKRRTDAQLIAATVVKQFDAIALVLGMQHASNVTPGPRFDERDIQSDERIIIAVQAPVQEPRGVHGEHRRRRICAARKLFDGLARAGKGRDNHQQCKQDHSYHSIIPNTTVVFDKSQQPAFIPAGQVQQTQLAQNRLGYACLYYIGQ